MQKKTLYIYMGVIVGLVAVFYLLINFLGVAPTKGEGNFNPLSDTPKFANEIHGTFDDPLDKPMDVTKIGDLIYVADNKNNRVQVFDTNGKPVQKFGEMGNKEGQFDFVYGIAGDKEKNVYVADMSNGKISIFDKNGKFVSYFKEAEIQMGITSPTGIRIVGDKLYVLNIRPAMVMIYNLAGKRLYATNTASNKDDYINAPNGIAVDEEGNVYVTESGNQRVTVYDSKLNYKKTIKGSKPQSSIFVNPRGVGVTSNGNVYVVDNSANRVFAFDKKGKEITGFGEQGDGDGQFSLPNGLFVDDENNIYVTDTFNQRVQIFK